MYETEVTVRGRLAKDPELRHVGGGTPVASFRLVSQVRRPDPQNPGRWIESEPCYYSVSAWRALGVNVAASLHKGEPVVVLGRQRIVTFDRRDGGVGMDVQIDASVVGHDLQLGVATYAKAHRDGHLRAEDRMNQLTEFADPGGAQGEVAIGDPSTDEYHLAADEPPGEDQFSDNGPLVPMQSPAA